MEYRLERTTSWSKDLILVEAKIAEIFVCILHYQALPPQSAGIRIP